MAKAEILMTDPVPPVEEMLRSDFAIHKLWEVDDRSAFLSAHCADVRALVVGRKGFADAALMDALPRLEIIAKQGAGYDVVDVRHALSRGVVVAHTPHALSDEVADFAIGLLLSVARQIPQATRFMAAGKWKPETLFPHTPTLRERKVGIVGLGRIGRLIARRCAAFDMEISYFGRRRQEDLPYAFYDSLLDMARNCDTLIVAAPGGAGTHGIVDAQVLTALGSNGIVVNIGRGSVIDQDALIAALRERAILSAGLDVFADEPNVPRELLEMEHVVLTPHMAGSSLCTSLAVCRATVANLRSWFDGAGPVWAIPETPWPASPR